MHLSVSRLVLVFGKALSKKVRERCKCVKGDKAKTKYISHYNAQTTIGDVLRESRPITSRSALTGIVDEYMACGFDGQRPMLHGANIEPIYGDASIADQDSKPTTCILGVFHLQEFRSGDESRDPFTMSSQSGALWLIQ
jgi:hypothetical protein